MAIETGTFPKIAPGVNNNPNFYLGPDAIGAQEKALIRGIISQTDTHTTVRFIRKVLLDGEAELLKAQVKETALFGDPQWDALDPAGKLNFARRALQKITKFILRGAP